MEDLEVIVQRMIDAGESEDNIALVIKDYNSVKNTPKQNPINSKGVKAEVNGGSDSPSAVEESSSESNQNNQPNLKEVMLRQSNPELYNELDSLNATIKSRPIMADNSKEQSRLNEINQSIENLSAPKKSVRKIYAEELGTIEAQMFEAEKKADKLSKTNGMSFEEILKSDGTYQDLRQRRLQTSDYKAEYDQILNKLKEDTNSDQADFLGKVGRVFGINAGNEQKAEQVITLSDKVEEQILLDLDSTRERDKIYYGYATLNEKEKIISDAKYKVVMNERLNLVNEAKAIDQTISDDSQRKRKLDEVNEKYNALLGEVGFDTASGILKNNFKKTDESQKFDEMVSSDGWFYSTTDAVSTLLEGVVQTGFKGTVGFTADMMSGFGDMFTDQDHYSLYDAFSDTVNQLGNYNYLPSSKSVDTKIVDDEGNFNVNYKTVAKSLAQTLPFTLAIVNDVKKGKITNIEASLGRLLNPTKSAAVSNSLRIIDSAYRHTLSDNLVMAEELGLDDNQGRIFANTLSMAEGMAELIMPDTKFFKTNAGDLILKTFKGDLKKSASKEAFKQTIKNFTGNLIKELGEEEITLATQDLLKYSMVVGHENSEFWNLKNQKELAAATIIMSGALGGANIRRDFKGNLIEGYRQVATNINGVTEELQAELDSGFHDETVKSEIVKAIDWANNLNKAITTSPVNVTGEQIDLLMEKAALVSEMKSVDDAFHPQYKDKIEAINIKINSANGKQGEANGTESNKDVGATKNVEPTKTGNAEQRNVQTESKEKLDDSVTPEQKTVYENTAKAIRSAKIYKTPSDALNKLSSNPAGLLAVAWDGALETVATTVELTGNLDAAIRKGVTQIKQSEWYKSLSPEGKKEALGIIESDLRSNLTPLAESVVPKSKQTVKATVRKATGQVDQSKKFTISEAKLLKDKFKNLAKGSVIGAKSVMEDKKIFIKDISSQLKSLVNSKVMTTTEATRILSAVNQFNGKNVDKVQPLVDKVVDAIEKRGLSRNIKTKKSSLRKASKSNRNPVNIRSLAKAATKVNEKYLDSSSQKEYDDLLVEIGNAVATPTSKKYNMAVEEEIYSKLDNLNTKAEEARVSELASTMGLEGQGLTESELKAIWESDNVDDYISTLKEDKAKEARLALEKQGEYALIALNDVDGTQLSEQERKDVRELKNADLSLLSSTDIRDLIKIVDNIVLNEDFSSSGEIVSKVRSYTASKEAMENFSKDEVNMIRKSVITDLKSVALIFKKVFMSAKKSATFNRLSGLNKLSMSYTKHKKAMDKLAVDYNDLFKNIKKKNSSITKPENTMLRGLVGQLIQGTTSEDFDINKSRVEDHIVQIKKNQSEGLREGAEKLQQEYDKLKDLKSQDEVIAYTKGLNDGNWDIIDFWLKHFESTKDALKYNTEVVHGKSFEEVSGNYLPIKMKGDIQHSVDVDNEAFYNTNGLPSSSPSTTTISRTKTKKLPKNRVLDLDFDSVMFNKASAVSIDVETSADYKDVYNFFRSPNMEEMFGRETLDVFNKKVKEMRRVQLGISSMDVSQDEITKNVTKVERMWKSIGTSIALGGLTQYPKQYISVVTNIIPNLGKHGGLMFKAMFTDKSNMPILDLVSISMRGETQGGTVTASTRVSEAEKKATKAMVGRIVQETGLAAEKVRNALFYSLRKGDVNVAKSSWVAFYQASLLDQGVDSKDIDMTTEHERLDDVKRQQAISYAELKVEETQISSDDSRGSEFYQSKEAYKAILRSLLLPFQSFNINSKMRMLNDLNIIGSQRATTEQKLEAAKSLLGTTSEIVTFQTMKYYILAPLIGLGKDAVMELFNLDAPDDDEESQKEFKFKQWYSALAKDLNPLTIGAFAEDMNIEVLNYLQYLQEGDSDEQYLDFIKRKQDDGGQLFYRYKDKSERNKGFGASLLNGGGLYAIPMTQFGEASETFDLMMKGTKRDDYGNLNEYNFTDEEKLFLRVAFAIELTSMFGLGEADTRRIFTSIRRDLVRNTDKQKIN